MKMEWTASELHTLRKLCVVFKAKDLAQYLPGRSVAAIQKQLQRLNLRHKDIVKRVVQEHHGRSTSEMADLAQCDRRMVIKYMIELNLRPARQARKATTPTIRTIQPSTPKTHTTMSYTYEHDLQVACVRWFRKQYPYLTQVFYSVPNGGFRNKATAGKMAAEGQQPGIADLCIDIPCAMWHGLRIEMKTDKGKQSEYQQAYENYCRITGYRYLVCRSLEDFQEYVKCWIENANQDMIRQIREFYSLMQKANDSIMATKVRATSVKASSTKVRVSNRSKNDVSSARRELEQVLGHGMGEIRNQSLRNLLQMN